MLGLTLVEYLVTNMNDTYYIEPLSDGDFSELLIRHMLLVPEVFQKAKQLNISGNDMVLDDTYGNCLYKEIINIIVSVDNCPISADSLLQGLIRRFDEGILDEDLKEDALKLFEYFYSETRPLERPDFFDNKLSAFIKKRRAHHIIETYRDDVAVLTRELNRLNLELNSDSEQGRVRIVNPFASAIFKTRNTLIGTGLTKIDEKIQGLMLGEYAMVIGYSGGGKTAMGINIIGASAEEGTPATYISCEEHEEDLSQRFYSRAFRIPYRQLRNGQANIELQTYFDDALNEEKRTRLAQNLCLMGMKGVSDITADYLYEALLQHYENTGFAPRIIMIDQLQFITPAASVRKTIQSWEIEKVVAAELDELSHKQLGDNRYVLWVQHQAKGKMKSMFSREEIDGFKGIIHKPDLVLGVGRDSNKSDELNIFNLKARHCPDFSTTLRTEFEYMTVTSVEISDTLGDQNFDTTNPTMTNVSRNRASRPNP